MCVCVLDLRFLFLWPLCLVLSHPHPRGLTHGQQHSSPHVNKTGNKYYLVVNTHTHTHTFTLAGEQNTPTSHSRSTFCRERHREERTKERKGLSTNNSCGVEFLSSFSIPFCVAAQCGRCHDMRPGREKERKKASLAVVQENKKIRSVFYPEPYCI